jgi:ABC-type phosphate transport system permease subunit
MIEKLKAFKPEEMSPGLYWAMLGVGLLTAIPAAIFGFWVLFTQIEFM